MPTNLTRAKWVFLFFAAASVLTVATIGVITYRTTVSQDARQKSNLADEVAESFRLNREDRERGNREMIARIDRIEEIIKNIAKQRDGRPMNTRADYTLR